MSNYYYRYVTLILKGTIPSLIASYQRHKIEHLPKLWKTVNKETIKKREPSINTATTSTRKKKNLKQTDDDPQFCLQLSNSRVDSNEISVVFCYEKNNNCCPGK